MSRPATPLPLVPAATQFPLSVSPDRRRLLDPTGRPVLLQGDAAWSLIANTTIDEATRYLDERRALGFNTIMVSVIEYLFSADPPRNLAGAEPFLTPGDFRTPNPAYMDHVERVLQLIADRGFLVLLAPAYLGYPNPHYPGFGNRAVPGIAPHEHAHHMRDTFGGNLAQILGKIGTAIVGPGNNFI